MSMGNILSLAKDCKCFLDEFPKMLTAFIEILFGVTKILQDMEEVSIDLKEIYDLLELSRKFYKDGDDNIIQQKADIVLNEVKQKLLDATENEAKQRKALHKINLVIENLTQKTKYNESL